MLTSPRCARTSLAAKHVVFAALAGAVSLVSACSSDTTPGAPDSGGNGETGGSGNGGKAGAGGSAGKAGSSGSSGSAGANTGDAGECTGAPSKGMNNADHCKEADGGAIKQATGKCETGTVDAGPAPADGGAVSDYGDTLYGTEGDDDDCKYHVKYTVAPICEKDGVTFTVTVTTTVDGKPVTGAHPYLELTLNGLPPGGTDKQVPTEKAGGVYAIGPVVFDKPGTWIARFHFFEECSDEPEDSPHGHIGFYIDVP